MEDGTRKSLELTLMEFNILLPWIEREGESRLGFGKLWFYCMYKIVGLDFYLLKFSSPCVYFKVLVSGMIIQNSKCLIVIWNLIVNNVDKNITAV